MNSTNFLTQRLTISAALVITNLSKLKKSDIIFLWKENTVNRSSLSKCLDDYKNFIVS